MNARDRKRKAESRKAHAERRDNRRPKGSPLLSDLRRQAKRERKS